MGSVKDLQSIKKPTQKVLGSGIFHFSDRYCLHHVKHRGTHQATPICIF